MFAKITLQAVSQIECNLFFSLSRPLGGFSLEVAMFVYFSSKTLYDHVFWRFFVEEGIPYIAELRNPPFF